MEPLTYIRNVEDLEGLTAPRTAVDIYGVLWLRVPSGWVDDSLRHRTSAELHRMRGPLYLLPEGFTGELNLDDLSDAEPGEYVMDGEGDLWFKGETGKWHLENLPERVFSSEDLLGVFSPLLPAPRRGDAPAPPPVPAMEAAAREEEARPVGFWRRLWNGLVWG